MFVLLDKIGNVNFAFMLNLSNWDSGTFPVFPEKKDDKIFGKNTVTF